MTAPVPHSQPNIPHVRAAFINAIAEEGTKDEAVWWLQKQWNETCALREALRGALVELPACAKCDLCEAELMCAACGHQQRPALAQRPLACGESTPVTVTVFASGDNENTPAEAVHHALTYAQKAGFIDGWSDPTPDLAYISQQPSIDTIRATAADAIRTFCNSQSPAAVQMSHGVERIYYAGLSLDALAVAVALALSSTPVKTAAPDVELERLRAVAWAAQGILNAGTYVSDIPREQAVREADQKLRQALGTWQMHHTAASAHSPAERGGATL